MKSLVKKISFFLIFGLVLYFLHTHIETAVVVGTSMSPTLRPNDILLLYCTEEVGYGDIVAVYCDDLGEVVCKRVIGVSGDKIGIRGGVVIRNGDVLRESYLGDNACTVASVLSEVRSGVRPLTLEGFLVEVEDGYIFLLGDNRESSLDSRVLGGFLESNLVGKVIFNITEDVMSILVSVFIFILLSFLVALRLCLSRHYE